MDFTTITENNFEAYALKHYNNPQCQDIEEFKVDLNERPTWIKRLLRRYHNGGELREHLILNHIIIFYNVFGIEPATKLLFFKLEKELYPYLKTFIVYLNYYNSHIKIPETELDIIEMDEKIIKKLRAL